MRVHGYPPGYLINEDKKIDLIGSNEDEEEIDEDDQIKEILYPGFNAPLPEGVYDRGVHMGFPPIKKFKKESLIEEHPSSPEIIFLDDENFISNDEDQVEIKRQRKWFFEPLAIKMFAAKPNWRRPPMLESISGDPYKDPIVNLEDLKNSSLIPVDSSCLVFGDQCIPTERLQRIQNILKARKSS